MKQEKKNDFKKDDKATYQTNEKIFLQYKDLLGKGETAGAPPPPNITRKRINSLQNGHFLIFYNECDIFTTKVNLFLRIHCKQNA